MYKHRSSSSPHRPSAIRFSGSSSARESDDLQMNSVDNEDSLSNSIARDLSDDLSPGGYNVTGSGLLEELRRYEKISTPSLNPLDNPHLASSSLSGYGATSANGVHNLVKEENDGLISVAKVTGGLNRYPSQSRIPWTRSNNRRSASDAGLDGGSRGGNHGLMDDEASNSDIQESVRGDEFNDDPNRKRKCLVCDDGASGYHYGVSSCEACKAFFKRTIQGNIEYACPANGSCVIDKRRRKACQACRYKKCLDVGMLKEGVRLDRVRGGRQKYRRTSNGESVMVQASSSSQSVSRKSSISTELGQLLSSLISCEPEHMLANITDQLDTPDKLQAVLCDLADRDLIGIIGWAKQIPGFPDLPLNDQMHLLQTTWCEILLFSLCVRSTDAQHRVLSFTEDFSLTEAMAHEARFDEVHSKACRLVESLAEYQITREEFLLMKCVILLNGGCALESSPARNTLRESIVQSLHQYVNGSTRSCNLLLLLPHLRQLDRLAKQYFFTVKNEGRITMHKLFLEMLESAQQLM